MNPRFTPVQAAEVSEAVYKLKDTTDVGAAFAGTDLANAFDFVSAPVSGQGTAERFKARTGIFEFKSQTGFAVAAAGKTGGRYENHAIFISRGTVSAYDWLSDANYAIVLGASGTPVHAGFNRTFNDMKTGLEGFLSRSGAHTVHCVGHSLGGAIATLVADWLATRGCKVFLYTFGCPRVGTMHFASDISRRIGQANIERVCHSSDPVTMVPVWPFTHAPVPDGECWVDRSLGLCVSSHFMGNYRLIFKDPRAPWDNYRFATPSISIEYGVRMQTSESLVELLRISPLLAFSAAVRYVVKGLAITLQPGVTLLDQMSMWVEKAKNMSIETDGFVRMLLQALVKIIGLAISVPQQITHEVIKKIFQSFLWSYHRLAVQATASAAGR